MRVLAIDLGDKRTGTAVGEADSAIITPLRVIEIPREQHARLLDELAREVDKYKPTALVLGLPINMDGTEGGPAKRCREFGAALGARTGLPVHFHDERLTTADADWQMAGSGLTRKAKKERRDALAAAAILKDYLGAGPAGAQGEGGNEPNGPA